MEGISMYGCRENNLKNINITIPYSKIVSFVGVSGSGKSTIVFDTLYAEGKRRYIESLGVNESYFLSKIKKPAADYFKGLPPSIALAQSGTIRNPRSTVGTISQTSYYLQVLFATCGEDIGLRKDLTPSMFNLNSPEGACMCCDGTGEILNFDELLIWPNQELSISEGGLKLGGAKIGTTKYKFLDSFLKQYGCDVNTPIKNFSNDLKVALLFGRKKNKQFKIEYPGIIPDNEKIYRTTKSIDVKEDLEKFMKHEVCEECLGTGYRKEVLNVLIDGKNIFEFMNLSIEELVTFLEEYSFNDDRDILFSGIKEKFLKSLKMCVELGLGYLTLSRKAITLSGGEVQRLKIVAQISSEISGIVYVLDEPSAGLHASDVDKILSSIKKLNTIGNKNTICLVEHTAKIMKASDYIFEIGPKAGEKGGYIVAEGTIDDICNNPNSLTGKYLKGDIIAGIPNRQTNCKIEKSIVLKQVHSNNLKNIDVEIPLEKMVCVTGVSGSGKTSLVFDSFYQSMKSQKNIYLKTIEGRELIEDVILCDQSTIGKSSRSNPATYLEIYEPIRRLFAKEEKAKKEKLTEASFSFNVDGGRCEICKGEGILKMNMGFLPEVIINCPTCDGKKFKEKILDVKYKGLSISDVLDLSIKKAIEIFKEEKNILIKLQAAEDVGLGYLKLGQITSSLSGGESQRLKLAFHLSKKKVKNTLFIFDEPTKGLHFEDVKKLLDVMKKLVKEGSSLLIVEHNLDMIASSDYVIDIGPEGGKNGGMIVGKGTPLSISNLNTRTGFALRDYYSSIKD